MSSTPDAEGDGGGLWLTLLCWIGLGLAALDAFLQPLPPGLTGAALALTFLGGGLPAGRDALIALWRQHRLDIDLLMVIATLAAAAVGAALEGAVLLALLSLSGTLERRAMAGPLPDRATWTKVRSPAKALRCARTRAVPCTRPA